MCPAMASQGAQLCHLCLGIVTFRFLSSVVCRLGNAIDESWQVYCYGFDFQVNPHIRKEKWTVDEDKTLACLVAEHGNKWADIAKQCVLIMILD